MGEHFVKSLFKFIEPGSVNLAIMNGDGKPLPFKPDALYIFQRRRQFCLGPVERGEELGTALLVPVLPTGPGDIKPMAAGIGNVADPDHILYVSEVTAANNGYRVLLG